MCRKSLIIFGRDCLTLIESMVIAKGDAREVGHTISDSSQYLACIMFINLFSISIKL